MTHTRANAVKELAEPVIAMLRELKVKCPECDGDGFRQLCPSGYGGRGLECRKCKGTRKVPYTYTPQVGEYFLYEEKIYCTAFVGREHLYYVYQSRTTAQDCPLVCGVLSRLCTPILGWEECFEILGKAGFSAQMEYIVGHRAFCTIKRPGLTSTDLGNSPIEATYRAILRLGKAIK